MKLDDVKRSIPAMERQGVSKVARGVEQSSQTNEGWVQAYIATGGSENKMAQRLTGRNDHETWKDRRMQFLSRHLAKVRKENEPLWRNGEPSRRHLALIAWGYTPTPKRLKTWLKTQPSLSSGEWKSGVKILKSNPYKAVIDGDLAMTIDGRDIPLRRNKMAPGYQSYGWTTQDWRSIFLHSNNKVSYDKKCGAKGTKLPSGKPRLCLPKYVIEQLLKTKTGTQILIEQARKKQRAKKGQRVAWHPKIKALHRELESRTPQDDPRLRRNPYASLPNEISQFFIDRDMPAVMFENVLMAKIDNDSLAHMQDYHDVLGIEIDVLHDDLVHVYSDDWDNTFIELHNLFH